VERREEDLRNNIFSWIWYLFLGNFLNKIPPQLYFHIFVSIDSFLSVLS
jgi:hypothetical protein